MMLPIDLPGSFQQPAAVMIALAPSTSSAGASASADRTVGVCFDATIAPDGAAPKSVSTTILGDINAYLQQIERTSVDKIKSITILLRPIHGSFEPEQGAPTYQSGNVRYVYTPEKGYFGPDKATILVDTGSRKVKLIYFIHVNNEYDGVCKQFCVTVPIKYPTVHRTRSITG